ncbi:MAG: M6 family metalloprotease domain-containing protein [Prevotella sp.]
MKQIILSLLLLLGVASMCHASKANPRRITVTLEDGRTVLVAQRGDEHFHYLATTRGEVVVRTDAGTYRIATAGEIAALKAESVEAGTRRRAAQTFPANVRPFPRVGSPRVLVVMMGFTDREFCFTRADFDLWLNGTEYNTSAGTSANYGSVAQYFNDCSGGKFRPQFDVVGPFKAKNASTYYGQNSGSSDMLSRYTELLKEACEAADLAGTDFTQYDGNGDGYVDLVYVIYAGYSEGSSGIDNLIWPKSGSTSSIPDRDGKKFYRYGLSNELYGGQDSPLRLDGIGVFCHEMCHTLGMPDVYPTQDFGAASNYDNQSMEYWDLMDAGEYSGNGYYPTPLTAWEREWLGWTDEMETIKPGDYTIAPLFVGGKGYRIQNPAPADKDGDEFYILENIPAGSGTGWYTRMFNYGLLVTHIHYLESKFTNFANPNNELGKPRWTIVPANGLLLSSYHRDYTAQEIVANYKGNTFPGTGGVTTLDKWNEYKPSMPYRLTDITVGNDGSVSFRMVDTTTGIGGVADDAAAGSDDGRIYTIDGRYAGQDIKTLPKGLYVKNGRKIVRN